MKTKDKQSCPTCGQSVNREEKALTSQMIRVLFSVWKWCEDVDRTRFHDNLSRFSRKEIDHILLSTGTKYATFGDLVYFLDPNLRKREETNLFLLRHPNSHLNITGTRGEYILNHEQCRLFFNGKREVATRILKDPLYKIHNCLRYAVINHGYVHEVPNLKEFLDDNNEFIVRYSGHTDLNGQNRLFP